MLIHYIIKSECVSYPNNRNLGSSVVSNLSQSQDNPFKPSTLIDNGNIILLV